jgi:hypothetical protein
MKNIQSKFAALIAVALLALLSTLDARLSTLFAQGTAFTYQGRLQNNGSPASGTYNLAFWLFNASNGVSAVAGPVVTNGVMVTNGLFTVQIDFGAAVFTGAANWLQIGVETNLASSFTTLAPRQQLTPSPYAIFAESAGIANGTVVRSLNGFSDTVNLSAGSNVLITASGNGLQISSAGGWALGGNAGTSGANFLGTKDNQPLELRVNNARALRIEPNSSGAPNVIGGAVVNQVKPGYVGATIAGGGAVNYFGSTIYSNSVTGNFGTVAGGAQNTSDEEGFVGGGFQNTSGQFATVGGGLANGADSYYATVGGGNFNHSGSEYDVIGGGYNNTNSSAASVIGGGQFNQIVSLSDNSVVGGGSNNLASGIGATVSGGLNNIATGQSGLLRNYPATVGGGENNTASGGYSTVPGGYGNSANGDDSFAAGINAQANHARSFIWSSYPNPAPTFGPDTFFVSAANGIGINCGAQRNDGGGQYWLNLGNVIGSDLIETSTGAHLTTGGVWANACDRNRKTGFKAVSDQEILEKLSALPVREWRYTNELASVRHLGPTAQDFKAAFGLGTDDKSIGTVDEEGVALAAIQGLNRKLQEKEARIQGLEQRLEKLEQFLNRESEGAR